MRGSRRFLFRSTACWLSAVTMVCVAASSGHAAQAVQPQAVTPATGANSPPAPQGANTAPAGPAPQQDATAVTDQAPGLAISVSLTDSFVNTRLPFDIPFYLTVSTADTAVAQITLNIYEVARRASSSGLIRELQNARNCQSGDIKSRSVSNARRSATSTFSLLVDELEPQRYYVLCFVSSGPVSPQAIATDVRTIFRQTAASLVVAPPPNVQPADVTQAMGNEIYKRLQEEITRLGQERNVPAVIPRGNIFFPGTVIAPGSRFALRLVPFISAYRALDREAPAYRAYRDGRERLRAAVAAASGGVASDQLTQGIRDLLPSPDLELPDRNRALESEDALDLTGYDFERVRGLLITAVDGAKPLANGAAISAQLSEVVAGLTDMSDAVSRYASSYAALREASRQLLDLVALESQQVTVSFGSSVLTADMNRNAYVSLDAGIAYPWRLENLVFYAGTNIYFRPINKEAPLRYKGTFLHRFALTVGITTTVKDDSRRASDLRPTETSDEASNSLLLGGGFRVTPSIRVGAGALIFKESDPNPLITQKSVTATPYVSFAADVNVAAIFKSFFPSQPE